MIRTEKRMRLCSALLVVNLIVIWGNSLLPGDVSGAISEAVKAILMPIVELFFPGSGSAEGGGGLLRKLAHFTEFACLGICLTWLLAMLQRHKALPLLFGFLTACVDETIQAFVPGRNPSPVDVAIDTSGVITGMILLLTGYYIYKKRKTNHKLEENEL